MRRRFNRALCLLLLAALLAAALPPAWAEELDEAAAETEIADENTEYLDFGEPELPAPMQEDVLELSEDMTDSLPIGADGESAFFSGGEEADTFLAMPAQTLDGGLCFYAGFNGNGNLDFSVQLPENAAEGAYTLTADDGQGSMTVIENAADERVISLFSDVRPDQIAYDMTLTVLHDDTEVSVSVRDYLAQIPESYGELNGALLRPANRALFSGAIDGVGDWHAGLDLTGGDTAVVLCFRTEDAEGLRFRCGGHSVTQPKQEDDGLWSVRVEGISAAQLPADLIITAEKGEQTARFLFSPFCCAARHWNEDTPFILLCKALLAAAAAEKV